MKRIYPLFLFAAFYGTTSAQLTQANHAPANGDTYSMWDCGTAANPGAAGNGVTWNFSSLTTNSATVLNYVAKTTTNTTYPNANVSVAQGASNESHYKSSASSLLYYGGNISVNNAVAGTLTYTDPAVEAAYPMALNTSSSSSTSGTVQVTVPLSLTGSFTGNSNVIADGTGTLMLPGGGSYTNVIRVLTSQTINITAITNAVVKMENYSYYASGIKAPVLNIWTATATVGGGSPSTQTIVTRNTAALGNGSTTTSIVSNVKDNVNIFPNPANDNFEIRTGSDKVMILTLTDITGKKVESREVKGSAVINTSNLPSGIYIYSLNNDGSKVTTGKLTIAH